MPVVLAILIWKGFNSQAYQANEYEQDLDSCWGEEVGPVVELIEVDGLILQGFAKRVDERLQSFEGLAWKQSDVVKTQSTQNV